MILDRLIGQGVRHHGDGRGECGARAGPPWQFARGGCVGRRLPTYVKRPPGLKATVGNGFAAQGGNDDLPSGPCQSDRTARLPGAGVDLGMREYGRIDVLFNNGPRWRTSTWLQ